LNREIEPIYNHFQTIDSQIVNCAPEWPIEKIARIDLAILRLAIYELTIDKKELKK